ncbi:hypothetical protein TRFO_25849 [Tritrichomonas foetus]|uniref:Uncharacterized protein n=1 Tax=Tritrichomonas foetus TaxID=1144522 RepID=A0A1J4K451_9EUKA|nr:hypothetical protein TRFO_25849 [Tritrichomonas foetus]|eukprot:OHT06159.1 hypothetical protein TRFO_25849 [Tritrichomonas foetus]
MNVVNLKIGMFIISISITCLSFFLIYSDLPIYLMLVMILSLIRWIKYILQSFPNIHDSKAIADFLFPLFLSLGSICLWILEFFIYNNLTLLNFCIFFVFTLTLPVLVLFTISFPTENGEYRNYFLYIFNSKNDKKSNSKNYLNHPTKSSTKSKFH